MTTPTAHKFHIGSVQLSPNQLHNLGALMDAYQTILLDFDWGKAPKEIREDERPHIDGTLRRGAFFKSRDFSTTIGVRVNTAVVSAANIEGARDTAIEDLLDTVYGSGGLVTLKHERKDEAGDAVSRVIYAEGTELPAPKWSRTDWGEGLVGRWDQPDAVVPISWHAPFPWWMDAEATESAALTLDGTDRTVTITNPCPRWVPLGFEILGSGTGLTVAVWNGDETAPGVLGEGITLVGVTLDATDPIVVDQFVTDPQRYRVYQDTTNLMPYLAPKPRVWLKPGANTIHRQVTTGAATGATLEFFFRGWYAKP